MTTFTISQATALPRTTAYRDVQFILLIGIVAVIGSIISPLCAFAQAKLEQPQAQKVSKRLLSLDEAMKLGMGASISLHTAAVKVEEQTAKLAEASADMLPSLLLSGSYTRLSDITAPRIDLSSANPFAKLTESDIQGFSPDVQRLLSTVQTRNQAPSGGEGASGGIQFPVLLNNFDFRLIASYTLFSGFRQQATKAMSEYYTEASTKDLERSKQTTRFTIVQAYWQVYQTQQLRVIAEQTTAQARLRLSNAAQMQKSGQMNKNDVMRQQVIVANNVVGQIRAANNERLAIVSLNNLLGLPLETPLELTTSPAQPPTEAMPSLDSLIEIALERRPDVQATNYQTKAADESIRIAQSSWFPNVSLEAQYIYANPNTRFLPLASDRFDGTWQASLKFSWTVWNWGITGYKVRQAEAQATQLRDALASAKNGIRVALVQKYLTLSQSLESIRAAKDALDQAQENNRNETERFQGGSSLSADLNEAQRAEAQAKANYINTLVDFQIAVADFRATVGGNVDE
jgi:outer membrane protein